jgi:signal transduction histidine kinase/DNA-binding response OmpR family regulator/ligand-binding sensor domain-containing protein
MKRLTLFSLLTIFFFSLYSQTPKVYLVPLPIEQGLKEHVFYCIMQDHKGFIWTGGITGLYRYNGYEVAQIRCQSDSFGIVTKIIEDSLGFIWLLTPSGIKIYDPEKERSMSVFQREEGCYWMTMHLDSRGVIWASDLKGIIKISYRKNKKSLITKDDIFQNGEKCFEIEPLKLASHTADEPNIVFSLNEDDQGNIWMGCIDGLYFLRNGRLPFIRLDNGSENGKHPVIQYARKILPIDENSVWILDSRGLYLLTNVKKALQGNIPDVSLLTFSLKITDNIDFLSVDRNKNFLVMMDKKIYILNRMNNSEEISLEFIGHDKTYPKKIENDYDAANLFEDKSGVIWITQSYDGVAKFKKNQFVFANYEKTKNKYISNINAGNIYKDSRENLWILNNNKELIQIQRNNENLRKFDPDGASLITRFIPSSSGAFLWIISDKGLLEFDLNTGKFHNPIPRTGIANDLVDAKILDLLEDGKQLYIAAVSGLFLFNTENGRIYKSSYSSENIIGSLIKMRNDEIWGIGSFYGFHKIEFNTRLNSLFITPVKNNLNNVKIGVSSNYAFYEDINGYIWMGNETGIHRLDPKTGKIKDYRLFENTDFKAVVSVASDNQNNLWLGTHHKLCCLNMITGKLKVFTEEDGVPVINYIRNSAYTDRDGRIYFGGCGGFYSFHPDSFKTNDYIPQIVLTDLRLFNKYIKVSNSHKSILTRNISYTPKIDLQHNQNDLSFEFAALDYNQPLKNKYAYKLEGYDKEWIYTDAKSRVATYTNLDPGSYLFRVRGTNNDEVWNEAGTTLTIVIHKPWWATTLAWCLYVLVFFGLIGGYTRLRIWRLKKEKLELERNVNIRTRQIEDQKEEICAQRDLLEEQNQRIAEQEQLKSRFFANVSHEFRTPLSLIQSPVEELLDDPRCAGKERKKLDMVQRNVRRLIHLVNQLLDISKLDASKMKLELAEADVVNHLRAIAGAFTALAETKSIYYACHFPKDKMKTWFDPDKLEKIAGNLLSNAFKFTPEGGEIILTALYKNHHDNLTGTYLEFSVKDTGPGIPAHSMEKIFDRFYQVEESLKSEGGGTGIGLSLAREMVKLLHGDILVESVPGKGSTFTVLVPLGKKHLKELEFIEMQEAPEYIDSRSHLPAHLEMDNPIEAELPVDKKPIILVVEDNRDIRMQLADNFSREYTVLEAIDGIAGLKKATEIVPDLIITDLMMPRMDGIELCQKLKNDERTCHIPVIMLTARVNIEDRVNGLLIGADDYVPKPFHIAELKARASNLITQRRKLREWFSRKVTLQPSDILITPMDEQFLNKAIAVIEKHLDVETFDLNDLRVEMNMTRSTLFRKIRALTGHCPTEFVRNIRLKRAANLLKQHFGNITQVSLEVGFNNLSYFNRSFKKLFGMSPHEYANTN